MVDFSTPEGKNLFRDEVRKRQALGMDRNTAEMLVAALLWEPPLTPAPAPEAADEKAKSR